MSVQTEIDRIISLVEDSHAKVLEKGGTTAAPYLLAKLPDAIETIPNASDPVLQTKTVTPTTSQQSVTPDSGYDGLSEVTVNAMPTATQATPSISVSSGGLITASATQGAGYVSAGTKSATKQLTTQAAKTVTPSKSSQTAVASGRYTTGAVTVAAIPSQYITTTDATAAAVDIVEGKTAYVNGSKLTGTNPYAKTATDNEVSSQASLISQIQTALEGKAAGGGSGGASVETCTVNINNFMQGVGYFTAFEDGHIKTVQQNLAYSVTNTINNVAVDSVMHITINDSGISNASTTGGAEVLHRAVNYDNTHYVIKCGNGPICNISIIEDDIVG